MHQGRKKALCGCLLTCIPDEILVGGYHPVANSEFDPNGDREHLGVVDSYASVHGCCNERNTKSNSDHNSWIDSHFHIDLAFDSSDCNSSLAAWFDFAW